MYVIIIRELSEENEKRDIKYLIITNEISSIYYKYYFR